MTNLRKKSEFFGKSSIFCPWNPQKPPFFSLSVHEWKTTILLVHCLYILKLKFHRHVFLSIGQKSELWISIPTVCCVVVWFCHSILTENSKILSVVHHSLLKRFKFRTVCLFLLWKLFETNIWNQKWVFWKHSINYDKL